MAYEGPRNRQGLTPVQAVVLSMDQAGHGPTKIAQQTGLSTSQVCNVKKWLKDHGHVVSRLSNGPEAAPPRSEYEPADDELPDLDEPDYGNIERCHCGLIKPCYHQAVSPWRSGDDNHDQPCQAPSEMEPLQSTKVRAW